MFKKSLVLGYFLRISSAAFAMSSQEEDAMPHLYAICQLVRHESPQKVTDFCTKNNIKLKADRRAAVLYYAFYSKEEDLGLHKQILDQVPGQTPSQTCYISFPEDVKVSEISCEHSVLSAKIVKKDPSQDLFSDRQDMINAYYWMDSKGNIKKTSLAKSLSRFNPPVVIIGVRDADNPCLSDRTTQEGEFTLPLERTLSIATLDPDVVPYLGSVEPKKELQSAPPQERGSKKRSLSPVEPGPSKFANTRGQR